MFKVGDRARVLDFPSGLHNFGRGQPEGYEGVVTEISSATGRLKVDHAWWYDPAALEPVLSAGNETPDPAGGFCGCSSPKPVVLVFSVVCDVCGKEMA
jgi:hypothetical protein